MMGTLALQIPIFGQMRGRLWDSLTCAQSILASATMFFERALVIYFIIVFFTCANFLNYLCNSSM